MRRFPFRAACLLVVAAVLPAAVVVTGGDGGFKRTGPDEEEVVAKAPAWVADPSEGGTSKAIVASWPNGAGKDEQKKARAEAIAKLREQHKLPADARVKEMNMWAEPEGRTYVLLVAR